ncbi:PEP-CTERM sorting domain-containing protein [Dapis sp. BLCC M126]|uniref:PEP-CTERM sorting domain-containing protein n=1 Tax=Dapis sp. BLCC M126 TaxID=3400189 RepID=UPI003CF67120
MIRNVKHNHKPTLAKNMKNIFLKQQTQPSTTNRKSFFNQLLFCLSSISLASSFALFAPAPEAAGAATLRDIDEDGIIDGVNDLLSSEADGLSYDVEFVFGSADTVGDANHFDFGHSNIPSLNNVLVDFLSLHSDRAFETATEGFVFSTIQQLVERDFDHRGPVVTFTQTSFPDLQEVEVTAPGEVAFGIWAKWIRKENPAAVSDPRGADASASTPEPSLILGFITLGGLMLGSKRKTNG